MRRPLALLLVAAALSACDRPRVDPVGVTLLTAAPDLSAVRFDPDLTLRLTPAGIDGRLDVSVNGASVPFDSLEGAFVLQTTLGVGLNPFRLAVVDDEGTVRYDTLYAVHLPIRPVPLVAPQVETARVAAASTPLPDGRVFVTGGVDETGRALASMTVLATGGSQIDDREVPLLGARAGHSASVLADGRVLLLGGARVERPAAAADFVGTAEVLDPVTGASSAIPVEGGVARAGHTAHVQTTNSTTYVYLFGGRIPAGSGVTTTGTVDVYRLDLSLDPTLVRLSPEGGAGAFPAVADHVQGPVGRRQAVILGRGRAADPVAFLFDWSLPGTAAYPFELRARSLPEAAVERDRAAAVALDAAVQGDQLTLVIGGEGPDGPLASMDVVVPNIGRRFPVPESVRLGVPRSGHTATILPSGRIVVSGGRSTSGAALSTLEAFQF